MTEQSHPTWVRGLKPNTQLFPNIYATSHPTWVRGLKRAHYGFNAVHDESHPTWERGLKQVMRCLMMHHQGRTLHGCVD